MFIINLYKVLYYYFFLLWICFVARTKDENSKYKTFKDLLCFIFVPEEYNIRIIDTRVIQFVLPLVN